jgi:hypothetical protein
MPAKKKIHKPSKDEGGASGPSAKETKQTRVNVPLGKGKSAQRREWWMQEEEKKKRESRKPKEWTNYPKGTKKDPTVPSAHTKKHNI